MKTLVLLAILLLASSCNGQCAAFYTIVDGDTCSDITFNNRISTDDFMSLNPDLDCENLQAGEEVCIAGENPDITPPAPELHSDCTQVYTVVSGDTCGDITFNNQISTEDFMAFNPDLDCDNLQEGWQVCLAIGLSLSTSIDNSEEEQVPVEEEQEPDVEEQVPVEEEQNPNEEEQEPAVEEQVPSEEEQNPIEEEQAPIEEEVAPVEEEEIPSEEDEAHVEEEQVSNEEQQNLSPFAEEMINAHQFYRDRFGCPRLLWNFTLETGATEWAYYLASNNLMEHSSDLSYGENIAGMNGIIYNATQYVDQWAAEEQYYVPGSKIFDNSASTTGYLDSIAHFTQVIWCNSTSVGCGMETVGDVQRTVCRYDPSGNRVNEAIY